jgi:geranylgeranyl diphosphate synthase type II
MTDSIQVLESTDLHQVRQAIDDRLQLLCQLEQKRAIGLQPLYGRLWQSIVDQVAGGGKRLRPYIVLLICEAFGGVTNEAGYDVAAAWELLHISMLMHDDIIDRDYSRHGKDNVAGQYLDFYDNVSDRALRTHYAHSAALLAGDLVLSLAHQLIDRSECPPKLSARLKDIFYEATFQVVGGELLDNEISFVDNTIDLEVIAEAKTASYSLIGPMLSGALLAGADDSQLELLRQLGRELGVGFQLADDILGVFGDEAQTGKSADSDLAAGKRTMVIVTALSLMNESDRSRTEQLLGQPSSRNVSELRQLIIKTAVYDDLTRRLQSHHENAQKLIDQLVITDEHREKLNKLSSMLLERSA